VARGALRVLVAGYLGTEPGAVPFAYGAHGKPGLVRNSGRTDLQFNLSHSGDVALVAFCVGHSIGVDLEHAERGVDALALAGRYGSPQEQAMLRAIAPDAQSYRFIELWTCKEAWLKAAGLGITAGLAGVDIEMRNGRPHVAGLPNGVGRADHWSLLRIDPGMGLVAAVALHDPARELGDIGARVSQAIALGLVGERLVVALRPRGGATTAAL
jgi:4'-phosphopantetheinyl transferase